MTLRLIVKLEIFCEVHINNMMARVKTVIKIIPHTNLRKKLHLQILLKLNTRKIQDCRNLFFN
jgi:hypothetical protein